MTIEIRHGDFRELLPQYDDRSFDAVTTDPFYGRKYLPLWSELARESQRLLKPGGKLVSYAGNLFLDEVLRRVGEHLTFERVIPILHTDGSKIPWKPLIVFCKPPVTECPELPHLMQGSGRQQRWHWCEQPPEETRMILRAVTRPGERVLDPFCGGGTTLEAAREMGLDAVGMDIDPKAIRTTHRRLKMPAAVRSAVTRPVRTTFSADNPFANPEASPDEALRKLMKGRR